MTSKEWWRSAFERQLMESQPEQALRTLVETQAMSVADGREDAVAEMVRRSQRYSQQAAPSLVATSDLVVQHLNAEAQRDSSRRGTLRKYAGLGHNHAHLHVGEPVRLRHTLALTRGLYGEHASLKLSGATCIAQGSFGLIEAPTARRSLLSRGGVTVRFVHGKRTRPVFFTPERAATSLALGYACRGHDLPGRHAPHRFAKVFVELHAGWMRELADVSKAVQQLEVVITREQYQRLESSTSPAAMPQRHQRRNAALQDGRQEFGL